MLRIVYSVVLPFFLPLFLYWMRRQLRRTPAAQPYPARELILSGLILVMVFLFAFSVADRAPADSSYTPPRFENGQIVPARMEVKNHADQ